MEAYTKRRLLHDFVIRHRQVRWQTVPKYLSSDQDPLYRFQQWHANLRVLGVTEIKTVPYVPMSHPFVERLIGTIRRGYLDVALFWTAVDLESKLSEFRDYYNLHRSHAGLAGKPAEEPAEVNVCATLKSYRWRGHCRGLFTRQSQHKQEFATDRTTWY